MGVALSLVLSNHVAAVAWNAPVFVDYSSWQGGGDQGHYLKAVATTGTRRVHLLYSYLGGIQASDVLYRRSADGGLTWSGAVSISPPDSDARALAIRPFGLSTLDALYIDEYTRYLYIRTSLDNGFAWSDALKLTGQAAWRADVARFADEVAVIYTLGDGWIRVRVSADGGETFGNATTLGQSLGTHGGTPTIINKNGTISAAWIANGKLRFRQSTDGGSSWSPVRNLKSGSVISGSLALMGAGAQRILVGYTTNTGDSYRVAVRTSFDAGAHWGAELIVGGLRSSNASFAYGRGVLRAAYQTEIAGGGGVDVKYKSSDDFGATWSDSSIVSPQPPISDHDLVGIGALGTGQSVVVYWRSEPGVDGDFGLFARTTVAE